MSLRRISPVLLILPLLIIYSCTKIEDKNKTKSEDGNKLEPVRDMPVLPPALPNFTALVRKLKPSVVNISTTSLIRNGGAFRFPSPHGKEEDSLQELFRRFFGDIPQREFRQRELGSGFIISEDGYIITNNHVVEKAKEIQVILEDEKKYSAKIVGGDPKTDLALLKIVPQEKLSPVILGNSDKLEIGNWVLAIGNPFGLGHTVTAGIVSAKGRILGFGDYDDFIQTDAPINPGNSGGPLFNLDGEVVGVTSTIFLRAQGIGFAIPINSAKDTIEQLKGNRTVVSGWLGVTIQDITPEIAKAMKLPEAKGALVGDVTSGSPADKAGVKRGDVIFEFNGHKIKKNGELSRTVATTPPGTEVELKLLRDGTEKTLSVKLGVHIPENSEEFQKAQSKLGLAIEELTPEVINRLGVEEDSGVIVTKVNSRSPADDAGFKIGDLILEINRKRITTSEDYKNILSSLTNGQKALFLVKRKEVILYIAMIF